MLELPTVTLACMDTRCHELLIRTIEDACRKVRFANVLIASDRVLVPDCGGVAVSSQVIDDATSKEDWERQFWSDLPGMVTSACGASETESTHVLFMEWDAGVASPDFWGDDFLAFDYIGAPWWYQDGMNVGNGGFSLRSRLLMEFLANNTKAYPCGAPCDELLCRGYRRRLEGEGFRWATEGVAHDFAFEMYPPKNGAAFGFHAARNWPAVLDADEVALRIKMAEANPVAKTKMADLRALWPGLQREQER